jgi:hypothetical protein
MMRLWRGAGQGGVGGGEGGSPITLGQADLDVFANALRANDDRHASAEEQHTKNFWRKQLRQFHKSLKDPNTDAAQGVQELFDSGAAYLKDGDLYTNVPQPKGKTDAMLDAVRQWQDKTGEDNSRLESSPIDTTGFDPQAYMRMMHAMAGTNMTQQELDSVARR